MIRSYTVAEIFKMRSAMLRLRPVGVPFSPGEWEARVEDMVRTYISAGCDPDEVVAAETMAHAHASAATMGHEVWTPLIPINLTGGHHQ
jgi:hypothetical protein